VRSADKPLGCGYDAAPMPAKAAVAKSAKAAVYDQLEALLKRYSPPLTPCPTGKVGTKRSYGLWSKKDVEIAGRKFPAVYFASLIEQKDFVGFYFTPVYMNPEIKEELSPSLLKLLKGKGCFHVKSLNDELLKDVESALQVAMRLFRKNGWV
jgi:hypothetical protein